MASFVSAMFVEAPSIVVFVLMQMSLGLTLNVIVGFSVVDGRWRGREAILDLDFTISHRCKCQFCQKRFSLRVLTLRRVCKQMTIVAMLPCCKTGAKVVLRRSTTLTNSSPVFLVFNACEISSTKCIYKCNLAIEKSIKHMIMHCWLLVNGWL